MLAGCPIGRIARGERILRCFLHDIESRAPGVRVRGIRQSLLVAGARRRRSSFDTSFLASFDALGNDFLACAPSWAVTYFRRFHGTRGSLAGLSNAAELLDHLARRTREPVGNTQPDVMDTHFRATRRCSGRSGKRASLRYAVSFSWYCPLPDETESVSTPLLPSWSSPTMFGSKSALRHGDRQ